MVPRDWSFAQRPLWGLVTATPAVAATCVAASSLLPIAVLGLPTSIAVIVGALVGSLGLAAVVTFLEHRYHSMPSDLVSPQELEDLNARRLRHGRALIQAPLTPTLEALAATLQDGASDQGLEGRQRFGTQQLTPTAAYARQAPQPIAPGPWQMLSYGAPDGMAYNPIASRGLGTGHTGLGAIAGGCIMDQMLIGVGAVQGNMHNLGPVRPGEVFVGSMVGAWTASLLGGGEAGYTALDGAYGLRLGSTSSVPRRDSLALQLKGPLPAIERPIADLSAVGVLRERSLGGATSLSLSCARALWGKGWLRPEVGQQVDVSAQQQVQGSVAHDLFQEAASVWTSWSRGVGRAWLNRDTPHRALNQNPVQRLHTLAEGDTVKLSTATRGGGIVAWGFQLFHPGLQHMAVGRWLGALTGFVGLGKLRQDSHLLEVRCQGAQGPKQRLVVHWRRQGHMTQRTFATTPGAVGYDYGRRAVESSSLTVQLPHTPAAIAAIAALHKAVRLSCAKQEDEAWAVLRALAQDAPTRTDVAGAVHSHNVTVPINLLPTELWSRWLPRGMGLETGRRWQSTLFEHSRTARAEGGLGSAPAGPQGPGAVERGYTLSHDTESAFGPEGRKLSRIEAQVALTGLQAPRITLANIWEMDRATSGEVAAFIHAPLRHMTEQTFAPLWDGKGWRADRSASLGISLDADQLLVWAKQVPRPSGAAQTAPNAALQELAAAVVEAHHSAQGAQGWAAEGTPGPLRRLADALSVFTKKMEQQAVPVLQRALAAQGPAQHPMPVPALVVSSDSGAYGQSAALVRELHLTRHTSPAAALAHADRVLGRLSSCRALLASDCLVGAEQRDAYVRDFDLAEQWARRLKNAV